MIKNRGPLHLDDVYNILSKLDNSDIKYYLTGSRYFGSSIPLSDWDFFTQDNSKVHRHLASLGFVALRLNQENIYHEDPTIVEVMEKGQVQIQLVKDSEKKQRCQEMLNRPPVKFHFLTAAKGMESREWWSWAFRCYKLFSVSEERG